MYRKRVFANRKNTWQSPNSAGEMLGTRLPIRKQRPLGCTEGGQSREPRAGPGRWDPGPSYSCPRQLPLALAQASENSQVFRHSFYCLIELEAV